MKQTIKNIIDFIINHKGSNFINIYPYFAVINDKGILEDKIHIDNDYCYYFNEENNTLYVENYETGKVRNFKVKTK